MKRNLLIGATFLAVLAGLGIGAAPARADRAGADARRGQAPRFEVDPTFPKPLPNGWYQGQSDRSLGRRPGSRLDRPSSRRARRGRRRGRQTPPTGECCNMAPPILEFDQAGNLLRHWGGSDGPGYQWPASNHGLNIDNKGNVWIGGNGAGLDGHVLKFTQDGKFVMQVGIKKQGLGPDSLAQDRFYLVAKTFFYAPTNEVFVADGYGNRRVAVIDADSGKMKRFWGAYGKPPDDKAGAAQGPYDPTATYQQFRGPVHCATCRTTASCTSAIGRATACRSSRSMARSCARSTSRAIHAATARCGTSRSRATQQQKYLYVADGRNQKLRIFDRAVDGGADELRQGRPLSGRVVLAAQHRDRFEGQPLHRRNLSGPAAAAFPLQGAGACEGEAAGRRLAGNTLTRTKDADTKARMSLRLALKADGLSARRLQRFAVERFRVSILVTYTCRRAARPERAWRVEG